MEFLKNTFENLKKTLPLQKFKPKSFDDFIFEKIYLLSNSGGTSYFFVPKNINGIYLRADFISHQNLKVAKTDFCHKSAFEEKNYTWYQAIISDEDG